MIEQGQGQFPEGAQDIGLLQVVTQTQIALHQLQCIAGGAPRGGGYGGEVGTPEGTMVFHAQFSCVQGINRR